MLCIHYQNSPGPSKLAQSYSFAIWPRTRRWSAWAKDGTVSHEILRHSDNQARIPSLSSSTRRARGALIILEPASKSPCLQVCARREWKIVEALFLIFVTTDRPYLHRKHIASFLFFRFVAGCCGGRARITLWPPQPPGPFLQVSDSPL
jgi:hypothetical protein